MLHSKNLWIHKLTIVHYICIAVILHIIFIVGMIIFASNQEELDVIPMPPNINVKFFTQPIEPKTSVTKKPLPVVKPKPTKSEQKTTPTSVATNKPVVEDKTPAINKPNPQMVEKTMPEQELQVKEQPDIDQPEQNITPEKTFITKKQQRILKRVNAYYESMRHSIMNKWRLPPSLQPLKGTDLATHLTISLDKRGHIIQVKIKHSSGNKLFDQSAIDTLAKFKRLEIADNPELYAEYFQSIDFVFNMPD